MKRILLILALSYIIHGKNCLCKPVEIIDYRGDSKLDTTIGFELQQVKSGIVDFVKRNSDYELIEASVDLDIYRFKYSYIGTSTFGGAKRVMSKYAEPLCKSCINSFGKNAFVEITISLFSENDNNCMISCRFRFQSFGESTGVGGVGPFPLNSKGTWEIIFLNSFLNSIETSKIKKDNKKYSSSGTCFVLNSEGYLATNYHVIEDSKKIFIRGLKGDFETPIEAKVVLSDIKNDIAIIKIDYQFFDSLPYKINIDNADVGESVYTLGYPLRSTMGEEIKLSSGLISSNSGFLGDITLYQFSAPIQPGNSGGPLFNSKGEIVGIVTSKHIDAENVSYAIKSSYIDILNKSIGKGLNLSNNISLSNSSLSDQVKRVRKYIFIVESEH
jgi:S1-C subfamily serine protease